MRYAAVGRHRRSTWSRARLVVVLVIAGLLAIMLPKALAPRATAEPGDWVTDVSAVNPTELAATPEGVYALHCSTSDATAEAGFYAMGTGKQQHQLPSTTPNVYPCDYQKAVSQDGTLYGVTNGDTAVVAYKAGGKLFSRSLVGKGSCAASQLAVTRLSTGVGGTLWVTAREATAHCPSQGYVFALSATSGAVQTSIALGSGAARWMQATSTGAAVLYQDGGQWTLRYFNAAGTEVASRTVQLSSGEWINYSNAVGAVDGTVYLPVFRDHSSNSTCTLGSLTTTVAVYGSSSKKGAYTLPDCSAVDHMAVGSWGAALYGWTNKSEVLTTISASGTRLASGLPKNAVSGSFIGGATRLLADATGNLVVLRKFTHNNGYDDTLVQIIEPKNGTVRQEFTTESFAGSAGFLLQEAALGKGYLYLLGLRCEGNASRSSCPGKTETELHGIAVSGLELESPFGNLLSATPEPPAELEFAFAGDSFISGEGVKPFETEASISQKCHRSKKAWPALADADSSLTVTAIEFSACSGATSLDLRYGRKNSAGKLVQPVQMEGLVGAKAKHVVISIGGNDVEFSKLIYACLLTNCQSREAATKRLLNELPKKLNSLIDDLRAKLGDDVQLYFVGYPYVLPPKACQVSSLSTALTELLTQAIVRNNSNAATFAKWLVGEVDLRWQDVVGSYKSGLSFSEQEAVYTHQVTGRLNNAILRTVTARGAQFINVNNPGSPFAGGHLCPAKGKKALFNGMYIDANPTKWKENSMMSFHPNESGAKAYLEVFRQYLAKHPQK